MACRRRGIAACHRRRSTGNARRATLHGGCRWQRPSTGDAPAAVGADRLGAGAHAPGEHVAFAAEYFTSDAWFQIAGRHRTAGSLVHAPGNRSVSTGDRLHALDVGRRVEFRSADRTRHEQSEHARCVHRVQHVGRQFARRVDARRGCGQQRRELAGPGDVVGRNIRPPGLMHIHRIVPLIVLRRRYTLAGKGRKTWRLAEWQAIKRTQSFTECTQSYTEQAPVLPCAGHVYRPSRIHARSAIRLSL